MSESKNHRTVTATFAPAVWHQGQFVVDDDSIEFDLSVVLDSIELQDLPAYDDIADEFDAVALRDMIQTGELGYIFNMAIDAGIVRYNGVEDPVRAGWKFSYDIDIDEYEAYLDERRALGADGMSACRLMALTRLMLRNAFAETRRLLDHAINYAPNNGAVLGVSETIGRMLEATAAEYGAWE